MAEVATPIFVDVDAFLAWEITQEERYEFVGGVVRLMTGGSANHDLVSMNIAAALHGALVGHRCRLHGSNLKLRSPLGAVMYPDCFVRCGPHRGQDKWGEEAVLVVEVLSPSTAGHDLGAKRLAYQAIPELNAALFIHPDQVQVELFSRQADDSWRSVVYRHSDHRLQLGDLGIEIAIADIYSNVELDPTTA